MSSKAIAMPEPTESQLSEVDQIAKHIADQVRHSLVDMLMTGKMGEVAAIVSFNQIQVERRTKDKEPAVKIERGSWVVIHITTP